MSRTLFEVFIAKLVYSRVLSAIFARKRPWINDFHFWVFLQSGKHPDEAEVPVRMFSLHLSTNLHHATKHGDNWLANFYITRDLISLLTQKRWYVVGIHAR
jgi:hypothetical protein